MRGKDSTPAQTALYRGQCNVKSDRRQLEIHVMTDAFAIEMHHFTHLGVVLRFESGQHPSDQIARQVTGQIGLFVHLQEADGVKNIAVGHLGDKAFPYVLRPLHRGFPRFIVVY